MATYYSASTNGFYPDSMREAYKKAGTWPDDASEISDELYKSLMEGQANGKIISSDKDGKPVLIEPVIDWNARAESQRQSLLTTANDKIADWKIELQLEIINDDDKASLIKWMAYIKALKALDITDVKDEAGFKEIEWPGEPE